MLDLWHDWKTFASIRAANRKPPQRAGLQLYRAADGTLLLFPTAWIYVLPEPVMLPPPYVHEAVGRMVLDMAEKWFDPPRPDGPPEKKPWMAVPGCRSYRAFCREYQLIDIEVEKRPVQMELSLTYIPRKDGRWVLENGDVELRAHIKSLDDERPKKTAHRVGSAVWKIFRLAQMADPLPPQPNQADKTKNQR